MRHIRVMLATTSLFFVVGVIDGAQADDRQVTLYTAPLRGDTFNCNAVNVSRKSLQIAFAILDDNGDPLPCTGASCSSPPPTACEPGPAGSRSPRGSGHTRQHLFGPRGCGRWVLRSNRLWNG